MATKINVRSPYYLDISEPTVPTVAFDCDVAGARNMQIDQHGFVTHPEFEHGAILSYTSSDAGYTNGKYATVSTDTVRTISYTLRIPIGYTNSDVGTFVCDVEATQPTFVCTGGISTNGTIPNQSIDSGGNTATIDLSSYFTASGDPISEYKIDNKYPTFINTTISGNTLTLTTQDLGGTNTIHIEATDGDPLTCDAVQPIQITVTNLPAFDCTTANLTGGEVAQDGTITDPFSTAEITAKSLTSGGAHITSVSANTGGSAQDVTLFFDLTVPDGYSNAGDTFICSKTFQQEAPTTLPTFDCDRANLTGQAIYTSGAVLKGNIKEGTIASYSPTFFSQVTTATPRTVTFQITPPASGFSNSGGSNISCPIDLEQPPIDLPACGSVRWSYDTLYPNYTTTQRIVTQATTDGQVIRVDGKYLNTTTSTLSELVDTPLCLKGTIKDFGNVFIPVRQNYTGSLMTANYITVLEVSGFNIIGVWQYNNNFYSSGYKTISKLY